MDHTYQSTMLMPASYAVLSEEEMTYLDGGADYSFNVGDYTVTLHPEVLVTYAMNVVVNGVYMLSQGSFQCWPTGCIWAVRPASTPPAPRVPTGSGGSAALCPAALQHTSHS